MRILHVVLDGRFVFGVVLALCVAACLTLFLRPVHAAQPAPPTVVPCQLTNTATLANGGAIEVFLCQPDEGPPYLVNSVGFMLAEDW